MMPSPKTSFSNPQVDTLVRHCLEFDECLRANNGAIVAYSGKYTGRTPKDKFIVRDRTTTDKVWWENNQPLDPDVFARLKEKITAYLDGRQTYSVDTHAGADALYRIRVRFIVERPYHALFVKQLLIRPNEHDFIPEWTIYDAGKLSLDPSVDGTRGDAVIAINFDSKEVIIAGTQYAGEMKKAVFTVMNYLLPQQGVLSMHCSANIGTGGDTALFFGLSGTGKTTLSADPERKLIGDDEHGWSDAGVFNIEGGCYAKCINLSDAQEPDIYRAIRYGAVLENVALSEDGTPDYSSREYTENTRAAYPLDHIASAVYPSLGGHPQNIFFLTCDALGVLPPLSRLTAEQAMDHFLNGYTAKIAGTEAGIVDPTVTFSTCFGAPFLPLHPKVYADMLREKVQQHRVTVWLVNTGWTGGPFGVGTRIKLAYTRAMLQAVLGGQLRTLPFVSEPVFGLSVPSKCPGVPTEVLWPRDTWDDPVAYDAQASRLKSMFDSNRAKFG